MFRIALHWQLLVAIVCALLVTVIVDESSAWVQSALIPTSELLGTLFLNALKLLVVPLVFATLVSSISNLKTDTALSRLGSKTAVFYLSSSVMAATVGLLVYGLMQPAANTPHLQSLLHTQQAAEHTQVLVAAEHAQQSMTGIFLRLVPSNIIEAAANNQMLGLIGFALLFGVFASRLPEPLKHTMVSFWQGMAEIMTMLAMLVMRFAPLGVFALMITTLVPMGLGVLKPMLGFALTVLVALLIHGVLLSGLALGLLAKVNPLRHIQAILPALLTAFSSASSSATLPVTMQSLQTRAGVSDGTCSFVLPLGATINMDGTALYECVAVLFIAQLLGVDLSVMQQIMVVVLAMVTSIGVAGVPAASLVALTIIFTAVGLPLEALGILFVTDRILDMLRTSVNVFSDTVCTVVIARTEGETTHLVSKLPID